MARSAEDIERILARTVQEAGRRIPIAAAYLFGSYSRGEATDDSDIDIALFSPAADELAIENKINLLTDIRLAVDAEVELHLFSDTCLAKARPSNLYGLIVQTGRRVA